MFTSAANADRDTGIPHFDSKYRIEQHLTTLGVPWTVIAPAAFMDQYAEDWTLQGLRDGIFGRPMPGDKPLALISVADIGAFAALTLTRPDEFTSRRIDIASDERTGHEIAAILGAACRREVRFQEFPIEHAERYSPDLAAMFRYFATVGMQVDIAALRREYPEVGWHTLHDWATGRPWNPAARSHRGVLRQDGQPDLHTIDQRPTGTPSTAVDLTHHHRAGPDS